MRESERGRGTLQKTYDRGQSDHALQCSQRKMNAPTKKENVEQGKRKMWLSTAWIQQTL